MRIPFTGLELIRTKAAPASLSSINSRAGWWPVVRESYTGAWQANVEVSLVDVLQHPTVFACVSLIASDIAKMRLRLVALDENGIWSEKDSPSFSPVLRKPNRYQTRIQFFKSWLIAKLAYGNSYILKQRDQRGLVTAMYVLDPTRVTPLVASDGGVWYELNRDPLSDQPESKVTVPASEVIHDVMHALYHPLVGLSPIYACGLAAVLGLRIQTNSTQFFTNGSRPGGVLTAPGAISEGTAARLKAYWDANFTGDNVGKVAVLGDGLKYEPMAVTAENSQLIEQWKATAEAICAAFHVPAYLVGAAPPPAYNNIEALNQAYYSQCLQELIESIELLLDEGLGLTDRKDGVLYGTEFDLDDLLRMDTATMMTTLAAGTGAGLVAPDEGRKKLNLPPVQGGSTPYLQQQNYSLSALARRDAAPAPSDTATGNGPTTNRPAGPSADDEEAQMVASLGPLLRRKAHMRFRRAVA